MPAGPTMMLGATCFPRGADSLQHDEPEHHRADAARQLPSYRAVPITAYLRGDAAQSPSMKCSRLMMLCAAMSTSLPLSGWRLPTPRCRHWPGDAR